MPGTIVLHESRPQLINSSPPAIFKHPSVLLDVVIAGFDSFHTCAEPRVKLASTSPIPG